MAELENASARLAVVVVLYNSAAELPGCLESIAGELGADWARLIVVDNASPDDSNAVARRLAPAARFIELRDNGGFAAGVNVALEEVTEPYVLLLNPDVRASPGALRALVEWMDGHPDVAVASPDMYGADGHWESPGRALPSVARLLLEASRLHRLLPPHLRGRVLQGPYWHGGDQLDAGWVPGTAMIVRRDAILAAGPLREDMFMYGEDIEWCWRIRRATGQRIAVCAGVRCEHAGSASAVRSWGAEQKEWRIAAGVDHAQRLMYGPLRARALALVTATTLAVEARAPGREAAVRENSAAAARRWLRLARGRPPSQSPASPSASARTEGSRPMPTLRQRVTQDAAPLVSITITTFNGVEYVESAVASALAQTYEPLEVVIVDDGSTDGTYERLLAFDDDRIRLSQNARDLGQAGNRNQALSLARGQLIKFLDHDDLLEPDCVARMAALFAQDPAMGLVFARRRLSIPVQDGDALERSQQILDLHADLPPLQAINDGRELLTAWLRAGLHDNWIGEPSAVMVSRTHLARAGGFNSRVRQTLDSDLWLRVIAHALVGFVDAELVTYRYGHDSETSRNARTRVDWLDRLWTLEALRRDPELNADFPEIATLLRAERRQAWRTVAKGGRGADGDRIPVRSYTDYARFRLASLVLAERPLAPPVSATSAASPVHGVSATGTRQSSG
jgi:GT2 family glycosyltransferase